MLDAQPGRKNAPVSAQSPNSALGKAVIATEARKVKRVRCGRKLRERPTRVEHSKSRSTGLCDFRGHVVHDAELLVSRNSIPSNRGRLHNLGIGS